MRGRPSASTVPNIDAESLDEAHSNLEQHQGGTTNIAQPTAILPTEILGMIFRECMRGETIHLPICYSCSTVTMPWVLGQVCSDWKNIAMNEPNLWSSLTLSYRTLRDKKSFTLRVKEIIFPRTKLSLMSLTYVDSVHMRNSDIDTGGVIATLVMPNLARFRHISLSVGRVALEPLITSPPGLVDSLESVELDFTWASNNDRDYPVSMVIFRDAQNLRKICLKSSLSWGFKGKNPLALPWSQLTELDISISLPYATVVKFLPHCTQLLDCRLTIEEGLTIPSPKITLHQLRSITLNAHYPNHTSYMASRPSFELLEILIVPALKKFALRLSHQLSLQAMVLALIARSGCRLDMFEISAPYEALDDIYTLLQAMPCLRKLVLPAATPLPIPVIKRMITGELVPHLEAMHCEVVSLPMTLDLLEIRRSGRAPGALEFYEGIHCVVLFNYGMMECKCRN